MVYSNPGDKIVLLNNVDLDFIYPIPINHPLTIDGNGFTLDIKHDAPAFYVNSPSVTLKNIRFENGNPALMWGNFSGTIKNCIFKSNCDGNDNVIRFLGCDGAFNERDLKAIGLNFINNTIDTTKTIPFRGKTFSELAKVLNTTNSGDKIILSNNVVQDTSSPLNVLKPITIEGNGFTMDMRYKSGGVFVASPFVTLNNIRFENGCPAIILSNVNVTVKNCTFKKNRGVNNGIIKFVGYDCGFNENDFKKIGLDFINNKICAPPEVVKFNGTTFTELRNQIEISNEDDTLILDNDVYQDTKEDIKIYKPITIDGNGHTLNGKNLYRMFEVFSDNVVLRNINFINVNTTVKWYGDNCTVKGCTFKNVKGYDGGVLECLGVNGKIKNCTFINSKGHNGGAIYISKDCCEVDGCTFQNCTAEGNGGAIFMIGSYCKVSGNIFQDCTAGNGGAIYVTNSGPFEKSGFETKINGCTFQNCIAKDTAGAIFFGIATDDSQVKNCTFKQNRAVNGGAIYWYSNHGNIVESLFERNSANNGGAIYLFY